MKLTEPTPQERTELYALLGQCFQASPDGWELWAARVGERNLRIARVDGQLVGGLGVYPLGQWFGGRSVPMGGVAAVGIAPEHRGRGFGARMVAASLRELHEAGVPLATLYASTQRVYRSIGFEQAGHKVLYTLPVDAAPVGPRDVPVVRAIGVHDLVQRVRPAAGNLDRSAGAWTRILMPRGDHAFVYLVGEDGYVVFTQEGEHAPYDIVVRDWCAPSPATARRIWTLLADHRSLAKELRWWGPLAEPMLALLPEARWSVAKLERWMLRLVDVPGALRARGWAADGTVHLAVRDPLFYENDGNWVLTVTDGVAEVRSGGRGELRLDVRGLAPLYSGLFDAFRLRALGWLEGDDAAVAAASRLFGAPEPWMNDHF